MEAVNGGSLGEDKGGPPPPSPLTGCYLLVVIGEPHSGEHKDIILQRVAKGLLSWDVNNCLVDLEKELAIIIDQGLEGEEARYGERLIQFASENLVTEILIHPAVSTLSQCVRNLLSSFTRHRHIIHAGYTFQGNGSWALQDGTFSYSDFSEAFQEIEVQRVIHAYENGISIDLHCSPEGDWTRLPKETFTKACKVRVNPTDVLTTGSPSISNFIKYLSPFLVPTSLENILESSDVVGNIRFSRPTLYVFPGGQGDAALFGINGFNMLLDGGYSRKACFWDFVRHLDRLDAVLMTRLNNSSICGISSVLKRKRQGAVYPQVGHFFCNIQERKSLLSPDGDKDKDPLIFSILEEGQSIVQDLQYLNLTPQSCYRDSEPIILYHKVGHGTLNMYVLSPDKNSREVREFLQKWNQSDPKLFAGSKGGREFNFPLQNLVSICALLVWQPANPNDTITRILYPGSAPQKKIFDGFDRLKSLEYIKHPVCTEKSLAPVKKSKQEVIEKLSSKEKALIDKKTENKLIEDALKNGEMNGDVIREKQVKKSDSLESDKEKKTKKVEDDKKVDESKKAEKIEDVGKVVENGEKIKTKARSADAKPTKKRGDSQHRKKPERKGPPTPKKTLENKTNGEITKEKEKKAPTKPSPSATPAKSTKDANNRRVVESKKPPPRKEAALPKSAPPADTKPKPERKPISRRPKTAKGPPSPMKKMTNGVQKPDSISKRGKLDKEGTTDSSTVSTPSADQESVLKKDISKLTPEEIQQLKDKELDELKEEQEAVKEIEAVFRKSEEHVEETEPGVRKIKDISIDDNLETEEYLIIEKEEIEHDSLDQETKEDEMQKLARDSEESEKQRKLSSEEKEIEIEKEEAKEVHKQDSPAKEEVPAKIAEEIETKRPQISSPEDKATPTTDKKEFMDEEVKEIVESHPEEKVSANVESGATTTAPTLPEDERITLDEIKEDNGQPIEEKHVKEETKEKEVPIIRLIPQSQQDSQTKLPPNVGISLDKQKHIRDIVKTPDEVADLPVHEEADYHEFHGEAKKSNEVDVAKESVKEEKKVEEMKEEKEFVDESKEHKPDIEKKEEVSVEEKMEKEEKEKEDIKDDKLQKEVPKEVKSEEKQDIISEKTEDIKEAGEMKKQDIVKKEEPKKDKIETTEGIDKGISKDIKTESQTFLDQEILADFAQKEFKADVPVKEESVEITKKVPEESIPKTEEAQKFEILEKAELETKEKVESESDKLVQEEKLTESIDEEWVVVTKEDDEDQDIVETAQEADKAIEDKKHDLKEASKDDKSTESVAEFEIVKTEDLKQDLKEVDDVISRDIDKESIEKLETKQTALEKEIKEETGKISVEETAITEEKLPLKLSKDEKLTKEKEVESESEFDDHEIHKEDEIEEILEKEKEDIKALIEEADKKSLDDKIQEDTKKLDTIEEKIHDIKETKKGVDKIDDKIQELKKEVVEPVEEIDLRRPKRHLSEIEEPMHTDLKEEVEQLAKIDDKLQELKHSVDEIPIDKEVKIEKSTKSPEHAEQVTLPDSSPEDEGELPIFGELDIDKTQLGRKSPSEREEDVKKIVASVAEVLKSEAPLEEFQGKLPFTQELRETHITTQDSPILEAKVIVTDDIPPILEEPPILTDETTHVKDKRKDLIAGAQELIAASSHLISDIKSKAEEKTDMTTEEEGIQKDVMAKEKPEKIEEKETHIDAAEQKDKIQEDIKVDETIQKPEEVTEITEKDTKIEEKVKEMEKETDKAKEKDIEAQEKVSKVEEKDYKEEEQAESKIEKGKEKIEKVEEKVGKDEGKLEKVEEKDKKVEKEDSKIDEKVEDEDEKVEERDIDDKDDDSGTVHRMLVTASSEDGGEEIEICPVGTITFSKSSESSGRSSPEPSQKTQSQKSSIVETLSDTLSTVKQITEKDFDIEEKEIEHDKVETMEEKDEKEKFVEKPGIFDTIKDTFDSAKDFVKEKIEDITEDTSKETTKTKLHEVEDVVPKTVKSDEILTKGIKEDIKEEVKGANDEDKGVPERIADKIGEEHDKIETVVTDVKKLDSEVYDDTERVIEKLGDKETDLLEKICDKSKEVLDTSKNDKLKEGIGKELEEITELKEFIDTDVDKTIAGTKDAKGSMVMTTEETLKKIEETTDEITEETMEIKDKMETIADIKESMVIQTEEAAKKIEEAADHITKGTIEIKDKMETSADTKDIKESMIIDAGETAKKIEEVADHITKEPIEIKDKMEIITDTKDITESMAKQTQEDARKIEKETSQITKETMEIKDKIEPIVDTKDTKEGMVKKEEDVREIAEAADQITKETIEIIDKMETIADTKDVKESMVIQTEEAVKKIEEAADEVMKETMPIKDKQESISDTKDIKESKTVEAEEGANKAEEAADQVMTKTMEIKDKMETIADTKDIKASVIMQTEETVKKVDEITKETTEIKDKMETTADPKDVKESMTIQAKETMIKIGETVDQFPKETMELKDKIQKEVVDAQEIILSKAEDTILKTEDISKKLEDHAIKVKEDSIHKVEEVKDVMTDKSEVVAKEELIEEAKHIDIKGTDESKLQDDLKPSKDIKDATKDSTQDLKEAVKTEIVDSKDSISQEVHDESKLHDDLKPSKEIKDATKDITQDLKDTVKTEIVDAKDSISQEVRELTSKGEELDQKLDDSLAQVKEKTEPKVEGIKESTIAISEDIIRKAEEVSEKVDKKVEDIKDSVASKAESIVPEVKMIASDTKQIEEAFEQKVHEVKDDIISKADTVVTDSSDVLHRIKDDVQQLDQKLEENIQDIEEQILDKKDDLIAKVDETKKVIEETAAAEEKLADVKSIIDASKQEETDKMEEITDKIQKEIKEDVKKVEETVRKEVAGEIITKLDSISKITDKIEDTIESKSEHVEEKAKVTAAKVIDHVEQVIDTHEEKILEKASAGAEKEITSTIKHDSEEKVDIVKESLKSTEESIKEKPDQLPTPKDIAESKVGEEVKTKESALDSLVEKAEQLLEKSEESFGSILSNLGDATKSILSEILPDHTDNLQDKDTKEYGKLDSAIETTVLSESSLEPLSKDEHLDASQAISDKSTSETEKTGDTSTLALQKDPSTAASTVIEKSTADKLTEDISASIVDAPDKFEDRTKSKIDDKAKELDIKEETKEKVDDKVIKEEILAAEKIDDLATEIAYKVEDAATGLKDTDKQIEDKVKHQLAEEENAIIEKLHDLTTAVHKIEHRTDIAKASLESAEEVIEKKSDTHDSSAKEKSSTEIETKDVEHKRRGSVVEKAEEFLDKTEKAVESVFSTIAETAKSVFSEVLPDHKSGSKDLVEKDTDIEITEHAQLHTLSEKSIPDVPGKDDHLESSPILSGTSTPDISKDKSVKGTEKPKNFGEKTEAQHDDLKKTTSSISGKASPETDIRDKKEDVADKQLGRRESLIEAAEEFIDKSERAVESIFSAIGGAAKSILQDILPEDKDKDNEVKERSQDEKAKQLKLEDSDELSLKKEDLQKEEKEIEDQVPDSLETLTAVSTLEKIAPLDVIKKEKEIKDQVEHISESIEKLPDLDKTIPPEKCSAPDEEKIEEELIKKEEKEIEKQAIAVEKSYDQLSQLTKSVSFDKCKPSEDFKIDEDILKEEEKQIDKQVDQLEKSYKDLSQLAESVSFDKCKQSDEVKVDKKIIEKEEKQIEERVLHLQQSLEEVEDLSKSISFDKCHLSKDDKSIQKQVDTLGAVSQETSDLKLGESSGVVKKDFKESISSSETVIDSNKLEDMHPSRNEKCEKEESVYEQQEKKDPEKDHATLEEKIDDKVEVSKEIKADAKKSTITERESPKKEKKEELESERLQDRLEFDMTKSVHVEKSDHSPESHKLDDKVSEISKTVKPEKEEPSPMAKESVVVEDQHISSQTEKCEKESMEKTLTCKDSAGLKVDYSETKKLSISDVEICIKTEICPKDASQSFLNNERSLQRDNIDAKIYVHPVDSQDEEKAGSSSVLQVTTEAPTLSEKSSPDLELSGKTTPPTVPVSPIAKDIKSPSPKVDSGMSEQTETDDEDLSTKSQVAHSQSDLDELDMKMDPMSMSFYGALPEEHLEGKDIPATLLYEITKAKYTTELKQEDEESETKKEEIDLMTASFIGELPSAPSDAKSSDAKDEACKKDAVDSWGKPLGLPAPTYLYEVTKAKFSSSSENLDLMTCSFIGDQLPTSSRTEEKPKAAADPMTTSVYFEHSSESEYDPIASWGKPLGLPSPAPPNNNEKGTPKKERKLPAYVTAKNKLNDDRKRAESPSKLRAKKINPVYVDLTYVPHHGNHYYSYVDFFKKIRARYYVFSGLEPSRQVYEALLEAKQTWEDKELEVTIIPTYDTDILGYWVAENEELLSKFKIDLSPSASRCTINLQDHETSCSAYRLEF